MRGRRGVVLGCGVAVLLVAVVVGNQVGSADPLPPAPPVYEGSYAPLGSGTAPVEPAGPTTEDRERQIGEEMARRGVTYEVDSSDLGDDQPSR